MVVLKISLFLQTLTFRNQRRPSQIHGPEGTLHLLIQNFMMFKKLWLRTLMMCCKEAQFCQVSVLWNRNFLN